MSRLLSPRIIGLLLLVALLGGGAWLLRPARSATIQASLSVAEALSAPAAGFARATEPRPFSFPDDHGPHQEYQTEWWYYTGNLDTADGRHFGYQLTLFRRGLTTEPVERASNWATNNIYMAHFALTDVAGKQFYSFERYSRDGAGLAGAEADPFRVWTGAWEAAGAPETGTHLRAAQGPVALDIVARSTKEPVLQGNAGLSQKSDAQGNASYYYSLTRMVTEGTITIDGQSYAVSGLSWKDREWATQALAEDQIGWDWFAFHLTDGSDLMVGQLRRMNGPAEWYGGSFTLENGNNTLLIPGEVEFEILDYWTNPEGIRYPSRWRITVPKIELVVETEPYLPDQELQTAIKYWEGAVRVTGTRNGQPVSGNGYIEMTGYSDQENSTVPNRGQ